LHGLRICQSREISGLLAQGLDPNDTTHDLAGPGLRDILDEIDRIRIGHGTKDCPDVLGYVPLEVLALTDAFLEDDEGNDLLALDLVGLADNCGLGNLGVADGCELGLSVGDPVACDLLDIVDSALDPPVPFLMEVGAV